MRRLLGSTLVAVAAFGIAATGAIAGDDELTFKAFLSGSKEVPGVATETSAEFKMTINEDLSEAEFRLEVDDGVKVTAAHLHCGISSIEGPVVAVLYDGPAVDVDGELAEGTLTNADILPQHNTNIHPSGGEGQDSHDQAEHCRERRFVDDVYDIPVNNIASLAISALQGRIYVNVHTIAKPGGEVRGQLQDNRD